MLSAIFATSFNQLAATYFSILKPQFGTEGGEAVRFETTKELIKSVFMEKKWYAVYTRPRWEKKVAEGLSKIGIENYCPLNKVEKRWSDRKKIVEEPLFTSYVFVKIDARQQTPVREVDGVLNLVYWLGKPAVIREEEIDLIRKFLNTYRNVRAAKIQLSVNDRVKIISGPLMNLQGEVISVRKKAIKLKIPSLGYLLTAEGEIDDLVDLLQ